MASISEFSLFDEPPKEQNNPKYQSKHKSNLDNLPQSIKNTSIFSFNKEDNLYSHATTNDKTIQYTPNQKNSSNNIKEVSSFSLCDNPNPNPKPLNRKLNFFSKDDNSMEIEDEENDSSMSCSPNKENKENKEYKEYKEKNNKSDKTKSEDDSEEEDFRYIKRQSRNNFSFVTPKFDEDYVIIKTLCQGEMGTVYLCMKFQDKKTYVVKTTNYFARKFDYYNMKNFLECINKNGNIPGANFIQKYIDFWIEDIQDNNAKMGNKNMYIVTDYCLGGDLKECIKKIKNNFKYDKDFYWDIIFQMIVSVGYLHKLGYIHFDIKPSNFLVQENGTLLLSDFCLTIKEKDIIKYTTEELEGDSMFISPELFYRDKDEINTKTDIFSLGLSILQILANVELPKNGLTWQLIRTVGIPKEMLDQIPYLDGDNQIFKNLIISMTNYNNKNRPDLESILNDKENYPHLYERYQLLLNNKYNFKFDLNSFDNFKRDSYDFSSSLDNFKKRFAKRSDSMKIVDKFKD